MIALLAGVVDAAGREGSRRPGEGSESWHRTRDGFAQIVDLVAQPRQLRGLVGRTHATAQDDGNLGWGRRGVERAPLYQRRANDQKQGE